MLMLLGLFAGMFLGFIVGVLTSDARSRKPAPLPEDLSQRA
jgi:hypothetical protein